VVSASKLTLTDDLFHISGLSEDGVDISVVTTGGGKPHSNQDSVVLSKCVSPTGVVLFFIGVLDGHGGDSSADTADHLLETVLSESLSSAPDNGNGMTYCKGVLRYMCTELQRRFHTMSHRQAAGYGGTTFAAALVNTTDNYIATANLGDSTVRFSTGTTTHQTREHNTSSSRERERVYSVNPGGLSKGKPGSSTRFCNQSLLSVTRGFGNRDSEVLGFSHEPEISVHKYGKHANHAMRKSNNNNRQYGKSYLINDDVSGNLVVEMYTDGMTQCSSSMSIFNDSRNALLKSTSAPGTICLQISLNVQAAHYVSQISRIVTEAHGVEMPFLTSEGRHRVFDALKRYPGHRLMMPQAFAAELQTMAKALRMQLLGRQKALFVRDTGLDGAIDEVEKRALLLEFGKVADISPGVYQKVSKLAEASYPLWKAYGKPESFKTSKGVALIHTHDNATYAVAVFTPNSENPRATRQMNIYPNLLPHTRSGESKALERYAKGVADETDAGSRMRSQKLTIVEAGKRVRLIMESNN
jgi:serine/threonine protein phosphatase PrpC